MKKILNLSALTIWFSKLSMSDKRAVLLLVIFLFATLMYLMTVWSFNYRDEQITSLEKNRSLMILLEAASRKFNATKGQSKFQNQDQPLLTLVSSTAKENQIVFKRFQPDGDNMLKLWLENVNFNSLLYWLHGIDKKNGISVQEISVDQSKVEGFVDVRLTLKR
jgi:general secretion pathway protein M